MKKKNKIMICLFAILIVFSSLSYFLKSNRKIFKIESIVRDYMIEVYSFLPKAFAKEKDTNLEEYLNKDLKKQNEQLKDLLSLNHTLNEFNYVNATVLYRNANYWLDSITIDKGSRDGIKENDSVITSKGLIGKIVTVNTDNSIISLLTTKDSYSVSVSINNTNGILYAYDNKKKLLKVKDINKKSNIDIGDSVTTNGLGGIFPSGLYIGKVVKVENDTYDLSKIAYVEQEKGIYDVSYVSVVGALK